jgi:hypothetical protein
MLLQILTEQFKPVFKEIRKLEKQKLHTVQTVYPKL